MAYYESYEDNPQFRQLIKLGRDMITLCEENKIFADDDAKWNACVTAGNRLVTVGTTYGLKDIRELSPLERLALREFMESGLTEVNEVP
tara:strand:- start:454 stop:720 length:267 start_codon:yes stop_codon:yes gene_type:complete